MYLLARELFKCVKCGSAGLTSRGQQRVCVLCPRRERVITSGIPNNKNERSWEATARSPSSEEIYCGNLIFEWPASFVFFFIYLLFCFNLTVIYIIKRRALEVHNFFFVLGISLISHKNDRNSRFCYTKDRILIFAIVLVIWYTKYSFSSISKANIIGNQFHRRDYSMEDTHIESSWKNYCWSSCVLYLLPYT